MNCKLIYKTDARFDVDINEWAKSKVKEKSRHGLYNARQTETFHLLMCDKNIFQLLRSDSD